MASPERTEHQQVDASVLLEFTGRLHDMRDRVEAAGVSTEQRRRWHTRLAAISRAAADDLERAGALLRRMAADLDRQGA